MKNDPKPTEPEADRVVERATLLAEERQAGSDDPVAQAAAILADSDAREVERERHPMSSGERRHSEDLVDPDALAN
jgi:hypothetical protein